MRVRFLGDQARLLQGGREIEGIQRVAARRQNTAAEGLLTRSFKGNAADIIQQVHLAGAALGALLHQQRL